MNMESSFDGASVLVVGGAGFVGSNLVRLLLESTKVRKVVVLDNLLSAVKENVPSDPRVVFRQGSVSDDKVVSQIEDEYKYIFHLATFHGNQSSIFDPIRDHENNTLTTLKLFNRIRDFQVLEKVVYSSAGCSVAKKTFDDATATTEESPIEIRQDSPYSISKIIGEFYSVYFNKQHGLPVVRARFQNVYGPGEILGAGEWRGTYATVWRNVTPTFIWKAIHQEELPLENEGVATRDFIFVKDICRGLMACAAAGEAGDVYNLGSGKETSIRRLAELINKETSNAAGIKLLPKRPWDNSGKRYASIEKAKKVIGFEAVVPIEEGIRLTVKWTEDNEELISRAIHKHDTEMNKIGALN